MGSLSLQRRDFIDLKAIDDAIIQANTILSREFMGHLNDYPVALSAENATNGMLPLSFTKISTIAFTKNENISEKLTNIYNVLMDQSASLVYVLHCENRQCELFLGVRDNSNTNINKALLRASSGRESIQRAFEGNFPGSSLTPLSPQEVAKLQKKILHGNPTTANDNLDMPNTIVSVSGIPSAKAQHAYIQGIEKLVDAMDGQNFTMIFIADALTHEKLLHHKRQFENLYTSLSPFASTDLSLSQNNSSGIAYGVADSISNNISRNTSKSIGHSEGSSEGKNETRNIISSFLVKVVGGRASSSKTTNSTENINQTAGETFGESTSKQISTNLNESQGESNTIQLRFQDKTVQNLLNLIDSQLERVELCEDLGAWNGAAYFISQDQKTAVRAAQTYKSLMRGEKSSVEPAYVNIWKQNDKYIDNVIQSVIKFEHPEFAISLKNFSDQSNISSLVSASNIMTGKELALAIGMPAAPIPGVAVTDFVPFSREVIYNSLNREQNAEDVLHLGNIFHMGKEYPADVDLDINALTGHTFITGAPGSGKSTTVYRLISEIAKRKIKNKDENIKFLIIEPAKGEYKTVFGGRNDVKVFSTDKNEATMLAFNPFEVPKNIPVEVHINRLVGIFNTCWSMYASMPSILKRAIHRCYEERGWIIAESICYENDPFPTFLDLLEVLPEIIAESEYSDEVKGNYTGALVERTKDLTVGIEASIFLSNKISDEEIFGQNCIIDLSQGLSQETRSLVMGFLIMKMDEYYKSQKRGMNLPLSHITVLEEAHNLLRKTSFAQSSEGSNIQGESVRMLTDAIKEMRSAGEGFLIVDQCPTALDESVIACTSTKIIHRLPNVMDYEIVGKSIGLSNEQLPEISNLKTGVAVVYQGDWVKSVLCKVPLFPLSEYKTFKQTPIQNDIPLHRTLRGQLIHLLLFARTGRKLSQLSLISKNIAELIQYLPVIAPAHKDELKVDLQSLEKKKILSIWNNDEKIMQVISQMLPCHEILAVRKKAGVSSTLKTMAVLLRRHVDFNNDYEIEKLTLTGLLGINTKKDKTLFPYWKFISQHSDQV